MGNKFVQGAPALLQSSALSLVCRPEITVETADAEPGSLDAIGAIGFWDGRRPGAALHPQRQGGRGYPNGPPSQNSDHSSPTRRELWPSTSLSSWL